MITSQHVLYVGSYAAADQPGIHACTFDHATGDLTVRGSFAGVANPSFVVVHPNGHWLYAVSETNQQQEGVCGADSPCHLEIDSNRRWLLVSNYGSGTIGVLPILADGTLGEMTDLIQHYG